VKFLYYTLLDSLHEHACKHRINYAVKCELERLLQMTRKHRQ